MFLLLAPMTAILGGLIVPLFSNGRARRLFVLGATLVTSAVLIGICHAQTNEKITLFSLTPVFSIGFRLDAVNRLFLMLIAFLWPLSILYSFEYMENDPRQSSFFTFYILAYGITQLLAMSHSLFALYLFYECLTLITLPLVTHYENEDSLRAGMVYLKYTVGGAALGLIGLIVYGQLNASGVFMPDGQQLSNSSPAALPLVFVQLSFLLAFIGFGAKAAVFPLSAWLPRVSVAPTPVTALLHAVAVVNAGVFSCIRLIYDCFDLKMFYGTWVQTVLLLLSSFTIVFGAVMAVRERHLKRRLAWSTVYNLSYMLFSASLMTQDGLRGSLTHFIFHSLMKMILFFCAGTFLLRAKAEYLPELRGLFHRMPVTVIIYTLAGVSLTGIPPFVGFLSKLNIVTAALDLGSWPAWVGAGAVILSSVLACVYLLEPAVQMFFLPSTDNRSSEMNKAKGVSSEKKSPLVSVSSSAAEQHRSLDPSWRILVPLLILTALIIVLGFWPSPVYAALTQAVSLY